MTRRKKLSYKELLESDWCPLFGVLPSFPVANENREIADRCNGIIERARTSWGIFDNDMVDDPWPDLADLPISMYREDGRASCAAARELFSCLDEIAWKTGPAGRNKIDGRDLRAGLELYTCDVRRSVHMHLMSEVNKVWCRHFPDDLDPNNPSSLRLVYSLFAIHEAWHILKWLRFKMNGDLLIHIMRKIPYAEGLLAAADHMAQLEEKEGLQIRVAEQEDKETMKKRMAKVYGKDGYSKGIGKQHEEAHHKHKSWQKMADEIWEKTDLPIMTVAIKISKRIEKKTGMKIPVNTIRQNICKKTRKKDQKII
ncbi:MAG: hypothetical protein ABSE05_15495 [Syntrophales bacterium]|jgi:hypothetical protein